MGRISPLLQGRGIMQNSQETLLFELQKKIRNIIDYYTGDTEVEFSATADILSLPEMRQLIDIYFEQEARERGEQK